MSVPIGMLSLASYIKPYGYQPIIIDLNINVDCHTSNLFRESAEKILDSNPQVLGFTVMCNTFPSALLIAEECKKLAPRLPIIFGGPEVSFEEAAVLETFKQVDIIVRREGEITLVELLKALEKEKSFSDILGITYREHDRIIRNPDRPFIENLDDLPFLDYSLLPDLESYRGAGRVEAGRGCPFQCTFCSTCKMWKRSFRMKSPQRLVQEIKQVNYLFKKDEKSGVSLIHDNFLASRRFAGEFLSLMAHEKLTWTCSSRFDALDETLIKKLKKAGCRWVFLGVESGSPEMQKEIKKNLPLDRLPHVLKLLRENKIRLTLSFIVGFPNESESQINQTLLLALNSKRISPSLKVAIFLFTFKKGSELYVKAKENIGQAEFWVQSVSPLVTDLPAEHVLIKKYPHIFPSFYRMEDKGVPLELLRKVHLVFMFLIEFFPRTASLLLDDLSLTPFQLSQKIIHFFKEETADEAYRERSLLSPHDFTAFITFVVRESRTSTQLMEILAEELYEFQCGGGKLSDYLTIVPRNDELILAQGISGKILVMKKKLFEEVVSNLYLEGPPEIEKAKKRLIEILAIVPAQLEEQKLIKGIFSDQARENVINNNKCIKCKHISFCVRSSIVQAINGENTPLCGDNFKSFLQENFEKIKETATFIKQETIFE